MFWSFKVCTWTKTDNDYTEGYSDNLPIRPRTDVCLGDDSEIYKEWETKAVNDEDLSVVDTTCLFDLFGDKQFRKGFGIGNR
jgi:hypothetical protein